MDTSSASLRFNQPYVRASEIAEQYYCERKVEMTHLHGRVETETKRQGSEGHESLQAESVEVERMEMLEEIFSGEPIIVHELPLLAEHRGVVLAGKPDAVIFREGLPVALLEVKFSNSPYPYRSYHVQARIYGRILDGAGFDTSDLFYVIAVAQRENRGDVRLFGRVIEALKECDSGEASFEVDGVHVYVYEYNQPEAVMDLDWALDYWRGSRAVEPVDNQVKCRNCEYQQKCIACA
jgi:CRISPR/Cas system-associated exonuclease Cas4 (RecB family)